MKNFKSVLVLVLLFVLGLSCLSASAANVKTVFWSLTPLLPKPWLSVPTIPNISRKPMMWNSFTLMN